MNMAKLAGKRILVTGGTRGIGFGIAKALVNEGAVVAISGRNQMGAEKAAYELSESTGGNVKGIGASLTEDAAVDDLITQAAALLGGLDILVNNAGVDADGPAIDHLLEDWRRVMRINLEVPFRLAQQAARQFQKQQTPGVIINVSSIAGFKAISEASSYVASKHGLVGLTKVLALEWAPLNIRVCGIAPGLIKTDMTEYIWGNAQGAAYAESKIPARRIGLPSDIGALTAFLASEDAGFIHGETIIIDGGATVG